MALKEGTWQWWLDLPSELRDQWLESLRAMMTLDGATPETVTDVPASLVPKLLSLDSLSEAQMQLAEWATLLADEWLESLRAMMALDGATPEVDAGDEGTPEAVTDAGSTLAPFHFPCDNVVFRLSGTVKQSHLAPDNATIIDEIEIDSLCAVKPEDDAAPPPKRDTTGAWQALCEQLCQLAEWATLLAEEDDVRKCLPAVGNFWQNRSKRDVCAIGLRFLGVNLALPFVDLPEPFPVATEGVNGREIEIDSLCAVKPEDDAAPPPNGREIEVETPVVKMPPPERTDDLRIMLRCPGCRVPWVFSLVEPLEHECKNCHRIFAPPAYTGPS